MEIVHIIKNILPGISLRQDDNGNRYYVMNGDLYLNENCEVEIHKKNASLKETNYDLSHFKKNMLIKMD